ncbi:solute carrier family 25 member 40-like [Scleropages formosus]|uniref:Solute carrier family 25 member 40-like n=1 Tax=Scleropages formosus TaxID=113540 RepID=A0A0P7UGC9_SCLFO|nr:solute carrier family 25 member 40-like [Scleropages formosus]
MTFLGPGSDPNRITPIQQMIASCSGAILTSLFGKCFVYCNGLMDHICVCENGNSKAWYKAPGHFTGTLDAFMKIIRREGLRSLWSGLPPTLVMAVPATVIYFTCYDQLCAALRANVGGLSEQAPLLAGAIARRKWLFVGPQNLGITQWVGSATVISPLELIRTKMQAQKQSYGQLSECVRSAVHNEGWLSLWRGLGPTLLRDVPFSALYWYNYEWGKRWLSTRCNWGESSFLVTFTVGALSGSVAAVLTLPFDVVKTRRQVELGELQIMNLPAKVSPTTYHVMKRIVTENGVKGLFAGFLPRLIKVAPACAIMISTYEYGKAFFRQHNRERAAALLRAGP